MYSKRYRAKSVVSTHQSSVHGDVEGAICYLAYFKVGYRGWFLFRHTDDVLNPYHRVHTSEVMSVEYGDDYVKVVTENTEYYFEVIGDEE